MSQINEQRLKMDEYLDGMLDMASQREVEAALAADPAAATMLARMKAQRALRTAAYASYAPTAQESSRFAAQVMAAAYQPVGRIGPWLQMRRLAGIAAAFAVLVGMFAMGRMTAPTPSVAVIEEPVVKPVYRVVYVDAGGIQRESEDIASQTELDEYVKELNQSAPMISLTDNVPANKF